MSEGAPLDEIEALYHAGLDRFVRTAAAITGSREAGRDAVQDGFVTAIRKRGQFRGEGSVEAWLWSVIVTSALKEARRGRQRRRVDELPVEPASANGHERGESAAFRAAVAQLPARQRTVVFLRYYADLEYEQIAAVLGIRRGTVSAALHAAHRTLRQHVSEAHEQ